VRAAAVRSLAGERNAFIKESSMFKKDDGSLSRRELLARLARAGAATPLALSSVSALAAQAPKAPANVKILGPTEIDAARTAGKTPLTPSDLKFKGFIRLSLEAGGLWYAGGTIALRKVGGQSRAFMYGNGTENNPVLEFVMPDNPSTDLASAPIAPLAKTWGTPLLGRIATGGDPRWYYPGGLYWDEPRKALWWSYGNGYAPIQHHPTIGCTVLNDNSGAWTSYGPWRTEWNCQRTRGGFIQIPASFASSYTSSKSVGIMASQASGNAGSPFGAIMSAMQLPDPWSTPADVDGSTHWTIASHGLILHDINHRQERDQRYRTCGWNVQYDCAAGSPNLPNPALFGGYDPASGENDTMKACAWVDLPDKHGVVYFGQLVTTPDGYTAPNDPDGFVHMWYGDPYSKNTTYQHCCHGQDDPWWGATGPGAHYRVPMGWIYNPNDLIATAQGKADLWSRKPTHTFQLKNYAPQLNSRYASGFFNGAAFDAERRRIYVVLGGQDFLTAPPNQRPVLMVFDIA
jgi:hypothetical protein